MATTETTPAADRPTAAPAHDRAALERFVDIYLDAVLRKDAAGLPLTSDARCAENGQRLAIGEGSFQTIDGLGTYRHLFADPLTGNVGFIGTVKEHGAKAMLDLRMRIVEDRIAEIETMIIRDPGGYVRYEALGAPEAVWLETVPPDQRMTREAMVRTVNRYFTAMVHNDGRDDYTFFHPQCDRMEHALKTTNLEVKEAYGHSQDTDFRSMDCRRQFGMGFLGFVTEIRDRRFLVIDEARQAILAMVTLDHDGTIRKLPLSTGKDFVLPPYFSVPRTLQVIEGFKLKDGMLYRIEMTLIETPYGTAPPWRDADDMTVIK